MRNEPTVARQLIDLSSQFEAILNAVPMATAVFDTNMHYLALNTLWSDEFELPENAVGQSHYQLFPNLPARWLSEHKKGLQGECRHSDFDYYYDRHNEKQFLRWRIQPWKDPFGTIGGIVLFVENITKWVTAEFELKRSEQRFKAALKAAGGAAWEWDRTRDLMWWSDDLYRLHGLPLGSVDSLKHVYANIDEQDLPVMKSRIDTALSTNDVFNCDFRIEHPVLGCRWMSTSGLVQTGENGAVTISGITIDVTDKKQLQESQVKIKKLNALAQVAGSIAHDASSLLTIILANLQRARELIADDRAAAWIDDAIAATEIGASHNRHLLGLFETRALVPQILFANDKVARIVRLIQASFNENIEIRQELEPGLWPILANPGDLDNAVVNLLTNARDAFSNGGVIRVSTQNRTRNDSDLPLPILETGNDWICLTVSDNGEGMSAETLKRIGDSLFTTKRPGKGSGLGFAGVIRFVKGCRGFMCVESVAGVGTSINLYLPRTSVQHKQIEESAAKPPCLHGRTQRVLVIQNDDRLRQLIVNSLSSIGFRAEGAKTFDQAHTAIESANSTIQIVFADLALYGNARCKQLESVVSNNSRETLFLYINMTSMDELFEARNDSARRLFFSSPISDIKQIN